MPTFDRTYSTFVRPSYIGSDTHNALGGPFSEKASMYTANNNAMSGWQAMAGQSNIESFGNGPSIYCQEPSSTRSPIVVGYTQPRAHLGATSATRKRKRTKASGRKRGQATRVSKTWCNTCRTDSWSCPFENCGRNFKVKNHCLIHLDADHPDDSTGAVKGGHGNTTVCLCLKWQ